MSTTNTPFEEPEQLAKMFHDTYERLAPDFGYKTREASAVEWENVPDKNKRLMIAVAAEITQLHKAAVREKLVEEWNLIHETLHSATIVAELHINEVTNDRIAALQGQKGEE